MGEAFCTPSVKSIAVIEEFRITFTQFGLPETLETDNGTCFVSAKFEAFLQSNETNHFSSAPYYLAEYAVQIVNKGLKNVFHGSIWDRLTETLMAYPSQHQICC